MNCNQNATETLRLLNLKRVPGFPMYSYDPLNDAVITFHDQKNGPKALKPQYLDGRANMVSLYHDGHKHNVGIDIIAHMDRYATDNVAPATQYVFRSDNGRILSYIEEGSLEYAKQLMAEEAKKWPGKIFTLYARVIDCRALENPIQWR